MLIPPKINSLKTAISNNIKNINKALERKQKNKPWNEINRNIASQLLNKHKERHFEASSRILVKQIENNRMIQIE